MNDLNKQWEEIELPESIDSTIQKGIDKGRRARKWTKSIISAVITIIFLSGVTGIVNAFPVVAVALSKIPLVGSPINNLLHGEMNIRGSDDLINEYNQQKTKDGITFTLKAVYYDIKSFGFGFEINGLKKIQRDPNDTSKFYRKDYPEFYGTLYYGLKPIGYAHITPESVNDNVIYSISEMDINDRLPEKCKLWLAVSDDVFGHNKLFGFNIDADFKKVNDQTIFISMDEVFEKDGGKVFIQNIAFTPVQIVLTYEYSGVNKTYIPEPGKSDYFDSDLYRIQLLDQDGIELKLNAGGFYTKNNNFDLEYHENRYKYKLPEVYNENITINIIDQNNDVVMSYKPLQK